MAIFSYFRLAVTLPLVLGTAGCAVGLGTVGTIGSLAELVRSLRATGPTAQPVQVTAEVQRVDTRRQLLQVETPDGRAGGVAFDLSTTVVHGDGPFPISSLGPGDLVNLHLQEVEQNNLYAIRIEVVQLASEENAEPEVAEPAGGAPVRDAQQETARTHVRERPADGAELEDATLPSPQRLTGEVGTVEQDRGRFELNVEGREALTVSLPFNPPPAVANRFRRLEQGETVSVEVEPLAERRVELRRFVEKGEWEDEEGMD
jgi:hypothetical protein